MPRIKPMPVDPYVLDQLAYDPEPLTSDEDERGHLIPELLPKLAPQYREVLWALYWQRLGVRQYARLIGRDKHTVQRRRDRALAHLKVLLEEEGKVDKA